MYYGRRAGCLKLECRLPTQSAEEIDNKTVKNVTDKVWQRYGEQVK